MRSFIMFNMMLFLNAVVILHKIKILIYMYIFFFIPLKMSIFLLYIFIALPCYYRTA